MFFLRRHASSRWCLFGLFFALLVFVRCAPDRWATHLDWQELSLHQLPDSSDYPQAHAVVLLDEGKVTVEGQGEIKLTTFERHKVIRILDRGGLAYTNVVIPYTPNYSTVEDIRPRTIHPDGRITVLNAQQIFDIFLYPNFIFYADQKAKKFTFPDVEPGDVLEFRYRIIFNNLTLYHSWKFQEFIPVVRSRFELQFPSGWKLHHKTYNLTLKPDSIVRPTGFKKVYRWQVNDMPALVREPAMPPVSEVAAYLLFAPLGFDSWKDVANWYYELGEKRLKPDKTLKQFTRSLLAGLSDERAKIQKIFEWTRDHIRYIAIAIGIGSFQPHFASEVFQNRYGDCKDMATLMCALARAAQLEMYPVLVSTRQNGSLDTTLATPFRFNHVIAVAQLKDGSRLYLDPTHKGAPFGHLPWYLENTHGLIIKGKDRFELVRLPAQSASLNRTNVNAKLQILNADSLILQLKYAFSGAPAATLRATLLKLNHSEQKLWLEDFLGQLEVPFTLRHFKLRGVQTFAKQLSIQAELWLTPPATEFKLEPGRLIEPQLWRLFRAIKRVHPIQFAFPFQKELQFKIEFTENWQLKSVPQEKHLRTSFGNSYLTLTVLPTNQINIQAGVSSQRLEILPKQYLEFRSFLDQVHGLLSQPFIWKKKLKSKQRISP